MANKIFYAAGPGNVVRAYKFWARGERDPTELANTYSSQVVEACRATGSEMRMVSWHSSKDALRDGAFLVEHSPKALQNAHGWLYYIGHVLMV